MLRDCYKAVAEDCRALRKYYVWHDCVLQSCYGMLQNITKPLRNVTEHCTALQNHCGSITGHSRTLRSITGRYRSITSIVECYRTLRRVAFCQTHTHTTILRPSWILSGTIRVSRYRMTSDLSSALEVCFKRDAFNKSMFTLLYFTER